MVNFGPLAAEIVLLVWGTPGNFNGFRVFGSVTARQSSSGHQPNCGGHHVGHSPTFLVGYSLLSDDNDNIHWKACAVFGLYCIAADDNYYTLAFMYV